MAGHPCCGGPHTAYQQNPLGHAVDCENYGLGASSPSNPFRPKPRAEIPYMMENTPEEFNRVVKGTRKLRPEDQQLPVPNDEPDVQSQVIADIEERRQLGISRYGTALQPHNGRDALRDAYEEAIDLAMYLKQAILERDNLPRRIVTGMPTPGGPEYGEPISPAF